MKNKSFRTVGIFDEGYDIEEVDDFPHGAKDAYNGPLTPAFDENTVQDAASSGARGGYVPTKIDNAFDRLEAAFVQERRVLIVANQGEKAWLNTTCQDAKSFCLRLLRPVGHRFHEADGWGHSKIGVDELIDRLSDYFDGETDLSAREVHEAVSGSTKDNHAYDESVIDVYLERAVSVLLLVE